MDVMPMLHSCETIVESSRHGSDVILKRYRHLHGMSTSASPAWTATTVGPTDGRPTTIRVSSDYRGDVAGGSVS